MSLYKLFGQQVKKIRKAKKMTQQKLAELLDVEPGSIAHIESGLRGASFPTIELLADALNVDYFELFDFHKEYKFEDSEETELRELYNTVKNYDKKTLKHLISYAKSLKSLLK